MKRTKLLRKGRLNRTPENLPAITRRQDTSPVNVKKTESQPFLRPSLETPRGRYKALINNRLENISQLLSQLETTTPAFEYITLEDPQAKSSSLSPNKVYRLDVDPKAKFTNYKDIQKLNLQDKQVNLEKMVWDLQDVLDNLVHEGSSQMKYLGDINSMLTHLDDKLNISPIRKSTTPTRSGKNKDRDYDGFERSLSLKKNMMDVGVQTIDSLEHLAQIRELEKRHYRYMMETLKNLRFKVDITSNLQNADSKASYEEVTDKNTLTIEGNIKEINQQLQSLQFIPKLKKPPEVLPKIKEPISLTPNVKKSESINNIKPTDSSRKFLHNNLNPVVTKFSHISHKSMHLGAQSAMLLNPQTSRERNKSVTIQEDNYLHSDLKLSFNLRLANLDPFKIIETRELPDFYLPETRRKYEEIEYIQWKMPELADTRFNIDDVMARRFNREYVSLLTYFNIDSEKITPQVMLDIDREVSERLLVYKFLYSKKMALRRIFLSYNIEGVQYVKDVLRMGLTSFVKLMKDAMLITKEWDVLEAVKVFYLSYTNHKKLPNRPGEDHRRWLRMLVKSYSFKQNYVLCISKFIEALVRITQYHPRFAKLAHLSLHQKFLILYQQNIKPNCRLLQGFFYSRLLNDTHVRDTLARFTPKLYELYESYMTKLAPAKLMYDFKLQHGKLELSQFYSFLRVNDILVDSSFKSTDPEQAEIPELRDTETKNTNPDTSARLDSYTPLTYQPDIKETVIRFGSSLLNKYENKNVRIHSFMYNTSNHHAHTQLLPFKRPSKNNFRIDKYTAYAFFITVLANYNEIYALNTDNATDRDFCVGFSEFVQLMGIVGVYYWKTFIHNENKSLIEALIIFLEECTDNSSSLTQSKALKFCKAIEREMLTAPTKSSAVTSVRQLLTSAALPQERFLSRRYSI